MNLSIRNLEPKHEAILEKIRRKMYGRGTNSGAIAQALIDWERNQSTIEELEARLTEALDTVHDYANACKSAAQAMERETDAVARLLKFAERKPTKPRQLTIR